MKAKKRVGMVATTALVIALGVPAIGSAALSTGSGVYEISVTYSDLDLTSDSGVESLYTRLRYAALRACGTTSVTELGSIEKAVDNKRCQSEFMTSAVAKVNNEKLSDRHES